MIVKLENMIDAGLDPLDALRVHRDMFLRGSDWTQMPDSPLTDEQRQAWATYRQALRDAPDTWTPGPEWDAPEPPA